MVGVNALLGWQLWRHMHSHNTQLTVAKNTVVFDTIFNHVTIHQYDTVYHTVYKDILRSFPTTGAGLFNQSGVERGITEGIDYPASIGTINSSASENPSFPNEVMGQDVAAIAPKNLNLLPYLTMSLLQLPQEPWFDLYREIQVRPTTTKNISLLKKAHLSLQVGPVYTWTKGAESKDGFSLTLGNYLTLGLERLLWWQDLSWNELKIESEEFLPGFPSPPPPNSNSGLEEVKFSRRDLSIHTGIGYALPIKDEFETQLHLGVGSNFRLGGNYVVDYEDYDTDIHYKDSYDVSRVWDGWNGTAGVGFIWQAKPILQIQLKANYYKYLGKGSANWRIPEYATMRLGVNYRWK